MIKNTPFSEYREEQFRVNVFDYFVTPSFFNQIYDAKPLLIYGSRGTGKTTLFKALSIAESQNKQEYLKENDYIGIYYRIDLNIMASFCGGGVSDEQWSKIFAYYFVSSLTYELIRQIVNLKNEIKFEEEKRISEKYGRLFTMRKDIDNFEKLKEVIYDELFNIRNFINNCATQPIPHIGDYATIIKEFPADILNSNVCYNFCDKIVFYLIDEFEGLKEWQQKMVLSLVKYSNDKHSFKICMRPDGLKSAETIGGEYIRETDDIKSIDLNEMIMSSKDGYYKYALDVCKKRMELFYSKNGIEFNELIDFENLFEEFDYEKEFNAILKKHKDKINIEISTFLSCSNITERIEFFENNYFDFLILKLLYLKNKKKNVTLEEIWKHIKLKDKTYKDAVHNYKQAILYNICLNYPKKKIYSGFKTIVDISGGTLRYLLEICNEIFENALINEKFSYSNPQVISSRLQTECIKTVSNKRLKQISAIPEIGLNIRTFIMALGKLSKEHHKEEKISKIEPNHFSIKSNYGEFDDCVNDFLKECVTRGVLIKCRNNKTKDVFCIDADEYLYVLHPIYTPSFQISWRRKQKMEFQLDEIKVLISNNTREITKTMKNYIKKHMPEHYSKEKYLVDDESECKQLEFLLYKETN